MSKIWIIITVSSILFIVFSIVIVIVLSKKKNGEKGEQEEEKFKLKGKGSGDAHGVDYDYKYQAGSQYNPSSFSLRVNCPGEGDFKLTKETGFDRFFKNLGIAQEVQTGHPDFDDEFYITTNHDEFTSAFFESGEKRQAAIDIYNKGFNHIQYNGKYVEAMRQPVKKKSDIDQKLIDEIAPLLEILGRNIPTDVIKPVEVSSNWKLFRILAFTVPILLHPVAGV